MKPGPSEITGRFRTREELERVIFTMKEKRYTQKYIAKECEISEAMVSNIVNNTLDSESRFALLKHRMIRGNWKNLEVHNEADSESDRQVGQDEEGRGCPQGQHL